MFSRAAVQSDTEVLLLVMSIRLGRFHGLNLLLEVVWNTVIWNVTVGLSLLYLVSLQILLKNNSPTIIKTKLVFQDIYIYIDAVVLFQSLRLSGCSACMGMSYFIRWGIHMDTRNLDTIYECLVTLEWSCTMVCIKNVWWIYRRGVDLLLGFCCMWLNVLILWGNLLHASSGWLNCSSGCCRDKEEENVLVVLGSLTDWLITPTEGRKRGQVCCEPTWVRFS